MQSTRILPEVNRYTCYAEYSDISQPWNLFPFSYNIWIFYNRTSRLCWRLRGYRSVWSSSSPSFCKKRTSSASKPSTAALRLASLCHCSSIIGRMPSCSSISKVSRTVTSKNSKRSERYIDQGQKLQLSTDPLRSQHPARKKWRKGNIRLMITTKAEGWTETFLTAGGPVLQLIYYVHKIKFLSV